MSVNKETKPNYAKKNFEEKVLSPVKKNYFKHFLFLRIFFFNKYYHPREIRHVIKKKHHGPYVAHDYS